MFKFQHCSSFAFNFIFSFSHLNWLGWWYPNVLGSFWHCKNIDFSTSVWRFGVNVSSLRTPRNNNWEILFSCSLILSSENFYIYRSRGDEPAISSRRGKVDPNVDPSSKLTDFLLNLQFQPNDVLSCYSFGLFPGGRLGIYSIALSGPYLNGAFPAERTLDLFVSKRIVFLWAYCSSLLKYCLLQIDSRNKRKAVLVWVLIPLYFLLHLLIAVHVSYLRL